MLDTTPKYPGPYAKVVQEYKETLINIKHGLGVDYGIAWVEEYHCKFLKKLQKEQGSEITAEGYAKLWAMVSDDKNEYWADIGLTGSFATIKGRRVRTQVRMSPASRSPTRVGFESE